MKTEIGGYFQLELNDGELYHENALKLNLGRSAFEYLLRISDCKKIYLPSYVCDTVLLPLRKLSVDYEFYNIDENLQPIFGKELKPDEVFYYVNFFGLKNSFIRNGIKFERTIIDNAHAFFEFPVKNFDTVYSVRKFFGTPDGAFLYAQNKKRLELPRGMSHGVAQHLLVRTDAGAEAGYEIFRNNENLFENYEVTEMSSLTEAILRNVNYANVKRKRAENFLFLHERLAKTNELKLEISDGIAPLCYPYLIENSSSLRKKLIENKVYLPVYWREVSARDESSDFEKYLAKNLLPLPIDQRYGEEEMKFVLRLIK